MADGNLTGAGLRAAQSPASPAAAACCAWDAGDRVASLRLPARGLAGPLPPPRPPALPRTAPPPAAWSLGSGSSSASADATTGEPWAAEAQESATERRRSPPL